MAIYLQSRTPQGQMHPRAFSAGTSRGACSFRPTWVMFQQAIPR